MSGHSHYATIKRQKESKDAARGNIFSKLTRAIQIAVKTGGGAALIQTLNSGLSWRRPGKRNMPKENIERAILKASSEAENVEEATYEGFGPSGVSIIVVTATDNRNRTGQKLKNLFERAGGVWPVPVPFLLTSKTRASCSYKKQPTQIPNFDPYRPWSGGGGRNRRWDRGLCVS